MPTKKRLDKFQVARELKRITDELMSKMNCDAELARGLLRDFAYAIVEYQTAPNPFSPAPRRGRRQQQWTDVTNGVRIYDFELMELATRTRTGMGNKELKQLIKNKLMEAGRDPKKHLNVINPGAGCTTNLENKLSRFRKLRRLYKQSVVADAALGGLDRDD